MFPGLKYIADMKARQILEAQKRKRNPIRYADALLDIGDINKCNIEWVYILFAYDGQQFDMIGCNNKGDIDEYAEHFNIFGDNDAEKTLLRCLPLNPLNLPYELNVNNLSIWVICGDWYIEKWNTIKQATGVIESMLSDSHTQIDDFAILLGCEENYPIGSSTRGKTWEQKSFLS